MFSCPLLRFSGTLYHRLVRYEKWIFLGFLVIAVAQVWSTRYVPSLDGPQHLYNANVLAELIRGNELFRSYFSVNDVIVGYWSGHFFLTLFKLFLPAWLAEKFFLTAYILGFVFSFRYLVRSLNPSGGNFIAFIAFPFVFHSYLLMGYYSFSIAAIFFFLAFGYWIRYEHRMNAGRLALFGLLVLGVFLSHALVFVLFGMAFVIFLGGSYLYDRLKKREEVTFRSFMLKLFRASIAVLPALILWVIYIRSVMEISGAVDEASYSFADLVKQLLRIRQLVGFHHEREAPAYIALFIVIAVPAIIFVVQFTRGLGRGYQKWTDLLDRPNLWIFISMAFLGLYLFAPDRFSAGSLTHRFGLFFFLAFIVWIASLKFPPELQVISLAIIFLSFAYTRTVHFNYYVRLNSEIMELRELSTHLEPNTVMHYQRSGISWTQLHFPLYTVVNEPVVHLRNPQCRGQFPVVWNLEELPRSFAGSKEVIPSGAMLAHYNDTMESRQVDYITIFKDDHYWQDSTNLEWMRILGEHYEEVVVSSGGKASLWKLIPR